ncbi:hypothetical protein AHIS2_p102 [Acaryochloris phage A-HIS2]|nr:hypothetical protein AHIS2_p102 [Acaryochloris phage A-HIS2]
MTLPHNAGSSISRRAFSRAPSNVIQEIQRGQAAGGQTGVVRGVDPRTNQAIVELDIGGQVRVAIPLGGRAFPGQIAQVFGSGQGGVYQGSFYFNDFQRAIPLFAGFSEITYTVPNQGSSVTNQADNCDINQSAPTSPRLTGGSSGNNGEVECPEGYSPNCDDSGNNCFGCKKDEEPSEELPTRPNLPGNPGDGCGGPGDQCDWYQGSSCPPGTFSKGFVEFPVGVVRSLCCGSGDRPAGDGCDWQDNPIPNYYSANDAGNACELNPTGGIDGRPVYGTLADCEADLFDLVDQWNPANTNSAGSFTAPGGFTIVAFALASGTGWNNSFGSCGAEGLARPCSTINPSIQPGGTMILPGIDTGSWSDNCSDCVYNVFMKAN